MTENTTLDDIEKFVAQYGETYRFLITDSLQFLDEHERLWNLTKRINRKMYVKNLVLEAILE